MEAMSERVLDSSDDQRTLVLVVSLRVLRDPLPALDASNEALALRPPGSGDVSALECLGRVVAAAQRDGRVPSTQRLRRGTTDVVRVDPAMRAELHAIAASRLASGSERLALADDVMRVAARLEREAPPVWRLAAIMPSALVAAEVETGDRDGD